MTYPQALAILGIDAATDKKSARRAYLRQVKKHKPESDPEGFQRVREAWELVEQRLKWQSQWAQPDPEPAWTPPPVRPSQPAPDTEADPEPAPEPEPAVDDEPARWEPPPEADAAAFTLAGDIETPDEPLEVPEPAPWGPPEPEIAPGSWTVEPPDVAGPDPDVLVGQAIEACDIDAEIALDALSRGLAAALDGRQPEPHVASVLQAVLSLHRAGEARIAADAWRAASRWIDASGAGIRIANEVAVWLVLARELSDLPEHFPAAVRRRVAASVLDHDPAGAQADLLDLYRSRPHVALDAADLLEAYAPNLHKMFGRYLRDPVGDHAPPPPHDGGHRDTGGSGINPTVFVYVAIVLLTVMLRMCVSGGSSTPRYTGYMPPPYTPDPIHLDIPRFEPIELDLPPLTPIEPIDIDRLMKLPVDVGLPVLTLCLEGFRHPAAACEHAKAIQEALERQDCDTARASLEALKTVPTPARDLSRTDDLTDTRLQVERITKGVASACATEDLGAP